MNASPASAQPTALDGARPPRSAGPRHARPDGEGFASAFAAAKQAPAPAVKPDAQASGTADGRPRGSADRADGSAPERQIDRHTQRSRRDDAATPRSTAQAQTRTSAADGDDALPAVRHLALPLEEAKRTDASLEPTRDGTEPARPPAADDPPVWWPWQAVHLPAPGTEPVQPGVDGLEPGLPGTGTGTASLTGAERATGPTADPASTAAIGAASIRPDGAEPRGGGAALADFAASLADTGKQADGGASSGGAGSSGATASGPSAFALVAGATPTGPAAADAVPRQVSAPLHSPAFAPGLGAQLNLMVRDGVTEARLHLNPAEMGPITVQIRITGQQARVEFAAEQALTRQVLDQAMPTLAGALRDSGLTLTGGGVFEQPRSPAQQDAAGQGGSSPGRRDGRGGNPGDAGLELPADRLVPTAAPRGVLDLYA